MLLTEADPLPQLGLPGQEVEPPADPGHPHQLLGVEVGEDPGHQLVSQLVEVAGSLSDGWVGAETDGFVVESGHWNIRHGSHIPQVGAGAGLQG